MMVKKQTKAISLLLVVIILLTSQNGTLLAMEVTEQQAFADKKRCTEAETEIVSVQDDSALPIAEGGNLETTFTERDNKQTETDVSAIQEEQAQTDSSADIAPLSVNPSDYDNVYGEDISGSFIRDSARFSVGTVLRPFDLSLDAREQVQKNTGAVHYRETLVPSATDALSAKLSILYDSSQSALKRPYYAVKNKRPVYVVWYRETLTTLENGKYKTTVLSSGWGAYTSEKKAQDKYDEVSERSHKIGDYTTETVAGLEIKTLYTYTQSLAEETFQEEHFGIGAGWTFDIPAINVHESQLYLPGLGNFEFDDTGIINYSRKDVVLTNDTTYGTDDRTSAKKAILSDGSCVYFHEDGSVLAEEDRFGNRVVYHYDLIDDVKRLTSIQDSLNRKITLTFASEAGKGGDVISITFPATENADAESQTIELHTRNLSTGAAVLSEIVYPDGENISFKYSLYDGVCNYLNKKADEDLLFQYALLENVVYDSGAQIYYTYDSLDGRLGDSGHLKTYRISEKSVYSADSSGEALHKERYEYTGNYLDKSGSSKGDYKTTIFSGQNEEKAETYSFDPKHRCISHTISGNKIVKCRISTDYDSFELPKKVTTTSYGTKSIERTELYTHDKYGNTLTYFSPKANGNANDTVYRTTYTYDSTYNLPLTVEYKQDAATTIKTVNTLTEDKKSIAETATYVNNALTALTTYTYNARGQVTAKTDCLDLAAKTGVTTVYTYNGANLATETITGLTDADGNALPDLVTAYTYDTMGRLLTATDAAGRTTTNTYDVRGRLLTTTAPDGSVTAYTYDLAANDTTVSQPGREDIVVDFDSIGQKQAIYYPSGDLQKEYYYDTAGRLVIEATGRGSSAANTVYYTYDPFDRQLEKRICDKDGVELYRETTAYDDALTEEQALVTKTVLGEDGAPSTVAKTYINAYGETVREDVGGVVTDYGYDFGGNRIRTSYTEGGRTVSAYGTYDFRGNLTAETNALGNTRTVTYDAIGRKIAESDFKGNATTYAYDAAGRLLISSAPLDGDARSVVKYTYDSAGNVTRQMQSAEAVGAETPVWRTVEYVYDDRNRVTDIAQTADETHKVWTHYAYNEAGDLTDIYTGLSLKWSLAVNPETWSHTRYVYNNRGEATSLTDALEQTETYVYDALGYLIEATGRDGKVTHYVYNGLGKPLTEAIYASAAADAPAAETVYTYYKNGLTHTVTADGSTVQYTYNAHGNVLTESDETATRTYTYDSRGRKSGYALTVGDTEISTAAYAYDDLNRLVSVTEGGVTTTYTYDANGNRASQTTGEVSVAYTYNDANLVTSLTNTLTNASGEAVVPSAFTYTYYADGNQHTKTETLLGGDPVTTTYVYDGLSRLTSETKGEDSITYTYDASSNRIGMNQNGTVTTYAYDANNRLLSETTGDTVTAYTYDANGNTLTAGDKTYTYNTRGQQSGFANETVSASYAYNPSGLRNMKTVGGSTKYFVYNGMNIVYEYNESVADGVAYFYGLNRTHNSEGEIYLYNAHGDVVQLVKDNAVVASYTYDAFGNLTSQIGNSENPFLYCGEYFDAETQTYYLRARYYNPANGRFNAEDTHWNLSNMLYGDSPVKLNEHEDALGLNRYTLLPDVLAVRQSSNLYTYCVANPIQYADLNGEFIISTTFLVVAGVAALGAAIGGYIGAKVADKQGKTGWDKVGYVATGAIIGGTIGAAAGYAAAPAVASATGVAGISVSASGISVVTTSTGSCGIGYASYNELKKALGPAGANYQWHHIVEQCQQEKSGFDAYLIQNTDNIIRIRSDVHAKISGYYSTTTFDFTNGLSVRDWLAGQSFEYQREFGLKVLKLFGVID